MAAPILSIVVPVLNEGEAIAGHLMRLQAARGQGAEIIVVDGGSSDVTCDLARPLADLTIQTEAGRARQLNAGAALSSGELLLFLHADTQLPDGFAGLIAQALGGGRCWGRFDVRIAGMSRWLPIVAALMNWRSRLTGIATGDQALFMTRAAFDAAGGFPDQRLMEDIALSRRLKRLSRPACLREKVATSGRRWDRNGAIRTILLMWRLRLAYFLGADPEALAESYGYGARRR